MSKNSRAIDAACFTAVLMFGAVAFAAPPVEVFGNLPAISSAKISPDGKHLAIIHPMNGRPIVSVFQLDSPTAVPKNVEYADAVAEDIFWADNNRVVSLFRLNTRWKFNSKLYRLDRAITIAADNSPNAVLMNELPPDLPSVVLDQDPADPYDILMGAWETDAWLHNDRMRNDDQFYFDLFRVSLATGVSSILLHGSPYTNRFLTDGLGHPIGRIDQTKDLMEHLYLGEKEVASYSVSGGDEWIVENLTEDGSALAVKAVGNEDKEALYSLKLGDSKLGPALFLNPNYDMTGVLFDDKEARVIGASYIDDMPEFKYFDSDRQKIEERLKRALPGQYVELVSKDATGANYVVLAGGPKNPDTFYIFSPATSQLSVVAATYPGLSPSDLGEVKPYPYKSRDGLDIHAYLTLPPGKMPKNLPTVIFPHGGPSARDDMEFDWWAQFMASRGYAVLQPNFRGSSGYGFTFRHAGYGEWAGKVQNDLSDGVQKLIADGVADPKRICIVGASYGGYAALAGATFNPNLYACAISYAGLSDLQLILSRETNYGGEESESSSDDEAQMGAKTSETGKLDAESPYAHADQVKIPILLIHSSKDTTVPIEQSEIENKALQSAGKNVQFITLEGDDHLLSLGATRIQLLKEVEKFLAANIGT
jgi:dipeptidyl aminopeptidase/acylaminoacyl peptidase